MFSGPERRRHQSSLSSSFSTKCSVWYGCSWYQICCRDSWVSTQAPVCGKSQRRSLFSEDHQQEGHGSCYGSTSSPRLPLTMGWAVLICCPIWVRLFHTHRASSPCPTHTPLTCSSVYLSFSPPWMDFLLVSCFLLTQTQKRASLFEQAEVYYPKYTISPVLQRKNILNQHVCKIYFYSKVMTGFLSEFSLAVRLTKIALQNDLWWS